MTRLRVQARIPAGQAGGSWLAERRCERQALPGGWLQGIRNGQVCVPPAYDVDLKLNMADGLEMLTSVRLPTDPSLLLLAIRLCCLAVSPCY